MNRSVPWQNLQAAPGLFTFPPGGAAIRQNLMKAARDIMTTIYLIRHAEAEGNRYRLAHGQYNSNLTPRGYQQLCHLRRRFREIPIDAVYGSDLFRTYATASAIFRPKDLAFHPLPLLREVHMGVWEGLSWAEIERLDRQMLINFNQYPHQWRVEVAEYLGDVGERLEEGLRQIARECPNATVAATSHGAASRILLGRLQGLTLAESGKLPHGDNTSVTKLEVEDGAIRVIYHGDASHLPQELSTFRRQTWHKSGLATEPGLWYQTLSDSGEGRQLQAMLGEEPAGRIAFHREGERLVITDYQIIPSLRGQRFGAQPMGQAVQFARAAGCGEVTLACGGELAGFFRQFGFTETGREGDRLTLSMDIRLILRDIPPLPEDPRT